MSAWRQLALGFCSLALIGVGGLAAAVQTGSGDAGPGVAPSGVQLAQATPKLKEAPEITEADLEKVSEEVAAEGPPEFTEEYLIDAANIEAGKEVWNGLCTGCHGARAYPGKAPKLTPKRYTASYVFHQATFGGSKMPAFGDVFTKEERMAVSAWVVSKQFKP
jgi:mono/diheme cytochrome c family protein